MRKHTLITANIVAVFLLFFIPSVVSGAYYYRFDRYSSEAMTALTQLKIEKARQLLGLARIQYPDNNIPVWLLNYADFIEIIVTEEEDLFHRYESNLGQRLDRLRKGDPESPYHKFCQAEVNLQWALARAKFKEYLTSLSEVRRSYLLLSELNREHPDFKPALISLGFLHTLIGSVPSKYQWAVRILGFNGDVNGGIAEMKEAMEWTELSEDREFYNLQCLFFLSIIYLNADSDKSHAVDFMYNYMSRRQLGTSKLEPLQAYALGGIALKTGHNRLAINMLIDREKSHDRLTVPYLDYMTGVALLSDEDDCAETYLYNYAHGFRGRNFIKAAWQRLAWFHLLKGDTEKYRSCMASAGTYGSLDVDADKAAYRDSKSRIVPNPQLLRARLLSDGGYLDRAQEVLDVFYRHKDISSYDKLEADYRQARIFDEKGLSRQAMTAYQKVYETGKNDTRYYAANSALKLGDLFERLGRPDMAALWYDRVESLEFNEYRNSLTQKARAGYQRTKARK